MRLGELDHVAVDEGVDALFVQDEFERLKRFPIGIEEGVPDRRCLGFVDHFQRPFGVVFEAVDQHLDAYALTGDGAGQARGDDIGVAILHARLRCDVDDGVVADDGHGVIGLAWVRGSLLDADLDQSIANMMSVDGFRRTITH